MRAAAVVAGLLAAAPFASAALRVGGPRPGLLAPRPLCLRPSPGHRVPPTVRFSTAATPADGGDESLAEPAAKAGGMLPPRKELKKILPLGLMFFFILFNYTILRDTKDVLVVTAPKSGAEIIPFLKMYVNLPGAVAFTVLYSNLTNRFSRQTVFYMCLTPFLVFFMLFAAVIYPNQALLHPNAFADTLAALLPANFGAPIGIIRCAAAPAAAWGEREAIPTAGNLSTPHAPRPSPAETGRMPSSTRWPSSGARWSPRSSSGASPTR